MNVMPWEGNFTTVAKTEKYKGNHPVVRLRSLLLKSDHECVPETAVLEQHTCCDDLSVLASGLHPGGVGWC